MSRKLFNKQRLRDIKKVLFYSVVFLIWIFYFPQIEGYFAQWLPERTRILARTPLYVLAWQHIFIVGVSTSLAIATASFLGLLVRLTRNVELKELVLSASAISETIPSAAVIALSVPILGYGNAPCLLALYLYAILPVVRNFIIGFESTPEAALDAGYGLGMTRLQMLYKVELPLAKTIILAGIRTALIINISAATIGATVGAGGFGVPIIAGIRIYDPVMVIQGSVPVLILALLADQLLRTTAVGEV